MRTASPDRAPRPVRPTAASAKQQAPSRAGAPARAIGQFSSGPVTCGASPGALRERERRRPGDEREPPTVSATVREHRGRGSRGRRAGANEPIASSTAPTNVPVTAICARGPAPGATASSVVSTALVDGHHAPGRRRSPGGRARGSSRQPRTMIAVASSPITATPVSSATRSDGAG